MSIFVEMTRTERNFIVDRLKTERGNRQSEVRMYELQLKNWERNRSQFKCYVDQEMKEKYRKSLHRHEKCVHDLDNLIAKLHAH